MEVASSLHRVSSHLYILNQVLKSWTSTKISPLKKICLTRMTNRTKISHSFSISSLELNALDFQLFTKSFEKSQRSKYQPIYSTSWIQQVQITRWVPYKQRCTKNSLSNFWSQLPRIWKKFKEMKFIYNFSSKWKSFHQGHNLIIIFLIWIILLSI